MLKILGEQMDHFARKARRSFEDRVVLHLSMTRPDLTEDRSEEDLRERVVDAMARAEKYGIVMERDALAFIVTLRWGWGSGSRWGWDSSSGPTPMSTSPGSAPSCRAAGSTAAARWSGFARRARSRRR